VKQQVKVPVTYADVWEFWVRNPALADVADFVTIHILPYWEDFPIAAENAAAHVDAIRRRVAAAFPGKEVLIGEVGWPSAGRMREGALPSPSNQARVIEGVLAQSKRDNFRVNVIEAFDQPWKRALEGTVGGHWGLLDDATRAPKFSWGAPVSNHPNWPWQAAGGVLFAALVFGAAVYWRHGTPPARIWIAVAVSAVTGGALAGWTIENVPLESWSAGGWARSLAMAAAALAAPLIVAAALASGTAIPSFAEVIGPVGSRVRAPLGRALGFVLIATAILAIMVALGLVFDPRYRDFPFAPLTAAVIPYLTHRFAIGWGARNASETACALILALAAAYITINETFANWQSLWLCAALFGLSLTLVRPRAARS
jgi:glucan 1,3-beta-glucosidase